MSRNIVRVNKNKNYTVMSNYHLNDKKLSWKAKGIHSYILSLPDDWKIILTHLETMATDKEKSLRSGLKELYDFYYWQRYPIYVDGRVDKWVTEIYEEPFDPTEKIKSITIRNNVEFINYECETIATTILPQKVEVGFVEVEKDELLNTNNTKDLSINNHSFTKEEKENERLNDNIDKNDFNNILINSNAYDVEEEFMTAIPRAIRNLYYTDKPLRLNDILTSPEDIREDLKLLRWKHIDLAIRSFKKESEQQELRNPIAYLSTCIYNSIFDSEIKLNSELRFNGHI